MRRRSVVGCRSIMRCRCIVARVLRAGVTSVPCAGVFRAMRCRTTVFGAMSRAAVLSAFESARMSAVRRRSMPRRDTGSAEVAAARRRIVTSHRGPAHRAARRKAARTRSQGRMTAQPAFPGSRYATRAVTPRTGMIEGVTAEVIAVSKLSSDRMATGETASADHVDRSRIVSERQIDRRAAPHTGDDSRREDGVAQVDAIVIAPADAEARIPGFAPAQGDPAHRIHHAHHVDPTDKGD